MRTREIRMPGHVPVPCLLIRTVSNTNGIPLPDQTNSAAVTIAGPSYLLTKTLTIPTNGTTTVGQIVTFGISVIINYISNQFCILVNCVTISSSNRCCIEFGYF